MFWSCKELPLSLLSRCAGVAWRSAHSLSSLLCVEALRTWQYVFAPPLFHLLLFFFLFLLLTVAPTGLQDAILDGIYGNSTLIFLSSVGSAYMTFDLTCLLFLPSQVREPASCVFASQAWTEHSLTVENKRERASSSHWSPFSGLRVWEGTVRRATTFSFSLS